jgi:hypothetical protein
MSIAWSTRKVLISSRCLTRPLALKNASVSDRGFKRFAANYLTLVAVTDLSVRTKWLCSKIAATICWRFPLAARNLEASTEISSTSMTLTRPSTSSKSSANEARDLAREATAEVPSPVVWDAEVESAQPRKEPRARGTQA